MTNVEINKQLNAQLANLGKGLATNLVKFVEGKEAVLKSELQEEIVKNLTNIDGLGKQLEKIQGMAAAFSKAFDENKDGKITPEEILAKATLLQQAIDGVNGRVDALTANVGDIKKAIEKEISDLTGRVSALEVSNSKNSDEITKVKANLSTNYVTHDGLTNALNINVQGAIDAFTAVLFPKTESDSSANGGDGAVE